MVVYRIKSENSVYIGTTGDYQKRMWEHASGIKRGVGKIAGFKEDFKKLDKKIIFIGEKRECYIIETGLIEYYRAEAGINCLNVYLSFAPKNRFPTKASELAYKKLIKVDVKQPEQAVLKRAESLKRTLKNKLPHFIIKNKSGNIVYMGNDAVIASSIVGIGRMSVHRCLRKERKNPMFTFEYAGGPKSV